MRSARTVAVPERAISRAHLVLDGDFEGTVHSVFPTACNIAVGELLITVHDAAKPHTPTSIRVTTDESAAWSPTAKIGDRVHCRSGTLTFGSHALQLRRVPVWSPGPAPRWKQLLAARCRVNELAEARQRHALKGSPLPPGTRRAARELATVVGRQPARDTDVDPVVRRLIGAGPGLTPAGDDILVGLLAALSRGGCERPAVAGAFSCLAHVIARHLERTTDISAHYLRLAIRGFFGEPLTDLIAAVVEAARTEVLHHCTSEVLSVGASSGADALLGVLLGLDTVLSSPIDEKVA